MKEQEIDPYYQREAKEFVDFLYDKKFLAEDCSREAMRVLEDYVGYILQSRVQMSIKAHELSKKLRSL